MSTIEQRESTGSTGACPRARPRRTRILELAVWALATGLFGAPFLMFGSLGDGATPAEIESPSTAGTVVFPHLYHVDELGFECVDCHHETDAAPLRTPHPEYLVDFWVECDSCHHSQSAATQPQSCGVCHGINADVADQTSSSKVAIHRSCWECHEISTGAEASRGCAFCHEVADEE